MQKIEMPMCAICGKVVDKMTLHDDINAHLRIFTVFCHGDRQEAVIEDWMVISGKIKVGMAFDQRRIGNAPA
jgi:hypothetical protein